MYHAFIAICASSLFTLLECPRNEEGDVGFLVEFYVAFFGSRDPENFLVGLENFRNPTHLRTEPVVRVEIWVAFSGSHDPVRFW